MAGQKARTDGKTTVKGRKSWVTQRIAATDKVASRGAITSEHDRHTVCEGRKTYLGQQKNKLGS